MKLSFYCTQDQQWKYEYDLLINHHSFKYAELVSTLWKRWVWRAFNEDPNPPHERYRLKFSEADISEDELIRHVMYDDHYSDDQ